MNAFTSWAYEIEHSIYDVGMFFGRVVRDVLPKPLVDILFFFPAILVVYWCYRAFRHIPGDGE